MAFTTPLALLLLLSLPYLIWIGRPRALRRQGARREWLALVVRSLIAVLLILGLAGAQWVRAADDLAVVYLVDASDSVSAAEHQRALDWVADAIAQLGPADRAAVVLFGGDALVERPLSPLNQLAPVTSAPLSLNTDLDGAIRLGMALLPAGSQRRLVILSDGIETIGDSLESARLAAAAGIRIDVHPLGQVEDRPEVHLAGVAAPTRLTAGDRFELQVTVDSKRVTSALLRVLSDGVVAYEEPVALARGENRFTIPLVAGDQGFARYRVQVVPAEDHFYQNNELAAFTEIVGPPRVLLVSPPVAPEGGAGAQPGESDALALALLAAGLVVERVEAPQLPLDQATLGEYAAIVLVDVNAKHLNPRKMAALQRYVRDLGGGLVAVGGPESYAPGGYYRTPLEEILPVEMQLKDQERRADLTMIYLIDKSGSMSDTSVGGIPKVELAKEAVIRSLELLGPMDRAGVVAFDSSAFWVVEPQEVTDSGAMADMVGSIRADGGTDIYAGLLAVAQVMPDDPAQMKHVILLTDGGASEVGNRELVQQMHDEYGVTLSVVAIGEGYADWIVALPELAEGRFHFAYDPDTIPEIFTQETTLATRAYIIEERFWPTLASRHPIISGITAVPPLYGYIGTTAKPAAQTILTTRQDDPLLAAWHYGLGKSVAWTSDATGRWGVDWVQWAGFPRFWEQAVRWAITEERGTNAETEVALDPGTGAGLVTVEAAGPDGDYLNGLALEARVVGPDDGAQAIALQQVAPGRYEGRFSAGREGAYFLRVAGGGEAGSVAQTAGWVLGYSPEYLVTEPDHDRLARLANLSGGKVLVEPWESLAHDIRGEATRRPIWPGLLLVAIVLLPLDVAVRRLVLGREELQRARAWLVARLPRWRRVHAPAAPRSEQVERLFEAKGRAAERPISTTAPVDRTAVAPEPPPAQPEPKGERAAPAEGTLASRLLDRKKGRQGD
jgi:Ca-activated chloride channel family protein